MRSFLDRYSSGIATHLGDPATSRRLTPEDKRELLDTVQVDLWEKLLRASGQESMIGYTEAEIELVDGVDYYPLPGNFRQFLSFEKRDSDGNALSKLDSIDYKDPSPGVLILSGQRGMRIKPMPSADGTWVLTYMKGPVILHNGTAAGVGSTTITFAETISNGERIDTNNYYAGALVHIYSATTGVGQVREIKSYDAATRVATLRSAWDVTPTGTVLYEISPEVPYGYDEIYSIWAAEKLTPGRAQNQRQAMLKDLLVEKLQACKSYFASNVADRAPEMLVTPDDGDTLNPYE